MARIAIESHEKKFLGKRIKLKENTTYKDAITKEEIPESVLKHHFKIVGYVGGLFGKKYKAQREEKGGKIYTVLLDSDYVELKLGK